VVAFPEAEPCLEGHCGSKVASSRKRHLPLNNNTMAASKRKSNAVDAQSTQTTKKQRTSEGATAAANRPRRVAAKGDLPTEDKEVKPVKAKATKVKNEARKSSTKLSTTPSKATPPNTKRAATTTKAKSQTGDSEDKAKATPSKSTSTGSAHERGSDEECFWLMKAEPESRLEKGIEVKFSIDDLAATTKPEPWDGMLHLLYVGLLLT
jgi:hypothetical protein